MASLADFVHHPLGHQKRGSVAVVTLQGNTANVQLLDTTGFNNYRNGRRYSYADGGLAKSSPVHLLIPRDGTWHVTVDLVGLGGSVRSGVVVEPPPRGPLPPIRQSTQSTPPLALIAENVAAVAPESTAVHKGYDVFISHAAEDKDSIVRDLAFALSVRGLEVWYDEFALRIGDNLRRKIDAGLISSRFGVVVLSPHFFAKEWPKYELDGLVTREMGGEQQIILPLWHGVTRDDVAAVSPSLANKVALRTDDLSVDEIARQIAEVVGDGKDAAQP